jgi:hypothetical protein
MKRLKIFKAYFVLWLFVYFIAITNLETFKQYFLSTLTFNIAIVALLAIGTFMLLKAAKDLTMVAGTFGVIMYKRGDISFYLQGIDKVFPSTIAEKLASRAKKKMLYFTQQEADDILAWLDEKFSNQNKYNNFFIGTVLMIGLLGTFAGLLGAISSMGGIVSSLAGSNVDISKIMAGFASPLSSMAVGFGSSLFGVISAVLLSIKGYILNKSQEALIGGVENWLQERTVESVEGSFNQLIPSTTLESRTKSYMDIFVDHISSLNKQMQELSNDNKLVQESLKEIVLELKSDTKINQETLVNVSNSLKILNDTNKESIKYMLSLGDGLKELDNHQDRWSEELKRRDYLLTNMISKQERRDEELKLGIFQIVDAIENMNKHISTKNSSIEKLLKEQQSHFKKEDNSKLDEISDFMKRHFSHQEER